MGLRLGRTGRLGLVAAAASLAIALLLLPGRAGAAGTDDRFSLAHGCFALQSASGKYVTKGAGGYAATAGATGGAEPFRMQATDLGCYLLYDATGSSSGSRRSVPSRRSTIPSPKADWKVDGSGDGVHAHSIGTGQRARGRRSAARSDGAGRGRGELRFVAASRLPAPIRRSSSTSTARRPPAPRPTARCRGLVEGHMHGMAFEFLGGRAHCGKPWSRYGAPYALEDCPDHYPQRRRRGAREHRLLRQPGRHPRPGRLADLQRTGRTRSR